MNFLAHLLLSFPNQDEMTGNFMGDFVKGNTYERYAMPIRRGILMHRAIDHFTDNNAVANQLVVALKPIYKRYAGVLSDIVFDHILAKNFTQYCPLTLKKFSDFVIETLDERKGQLPSRVAFVLDRITETKRLQLYASLVGLKDSIDIMARHTSIPDHSEELVMFIEKKEDFITGIFHRFYPELEDYVEKKRAELLLVL